MVTGVTKTAPHIILACILALAAVALAPSRAAGLGQQVHYVGEYLDVTDVQRIGHALDTAATRTPVQWENARTGYQYSLMVFTTGRTNEGMVRRFSVLAIEPSGQAELLELVGRSASRNVWHIVAESPSSPVGKAARMTLDQTPVPAARTSSGGSFKGFVIEG